ncbi:MAG TPA: SDR family oxidoreductase [Parvularculaceae bacterium]|nr:SDR family oxidoreductase [Parvularculaceae bacterium]
MKTEARRAIITGGGSGIGLAIARRFANAGVDVTIAGRDAARLEKTGLPYVTMDVADEASVVEGVAKCGRVDIFIANAGAAETAPALKTQRVMWDRMIAVNLTSAYLCAREALPQMIGRGWGRFIAIGSTASLKGYAYAGAYAASKHGLLGWVRTLALELAKSGVTANAICPGYTDTPLIAGAVDAIMQKTGRDKADASATFAKSNPMGRLILPEEVAAAALWLASDDAASVNGQAITIDGGETIS